MDTLGIEPTMCPCCPELETACRACCQPTQGHPALNLVVVGSRPTVGVPAAARSTFGLRDLGRWIQFHKVRRARIKLTTLAL